MVIVFAYHRGFHQFLFVDFVFPLFRRVGGDGLLIACQILSGYGNCHS
ncbi:hypothetical protein GA0061071_102480 [Kosakonia oryzendophytica]|uniref:Uncharacterized protein n=1 Tax=Kosakonia oryzendophytica TaxID=1005665 RepID=A0A1C4A6N3_9ENTR|nr:hypothetical protein DFO53_3374 [Enterobacter sp. AG5470]SCB90364.1 hypothetical protein GA0061071_102480 [Kosakonia oryzendophytica]